jgi:hypothetical protein
MVKFSARYHSIYLIFFVFERACQDAGHDGVLFLKFLLFKRRRGITSSRAPETLRKWVSNDISAYIRIYIIQTKLN